MERCGAAERLADRLRGELAQSRETGEGAQKALAMRWRFGGEAEDQRTAASLRAELAEALTI